MLLVCSKFDTDTRHKHIILQSNSYANDRAKCCLCATQHSTATFRHNATPPNYTCSAFENSSFSMLTRTRALVYLSMCLLCVHCERSNVRSAHIDGTEIDRHGMWQCEWARAPRSAQPACCWSDEQTKRTPCTTKLRNNKSFHIDDALCECARLVWWRRNDELNSKHSNLITRVCNSRVCVFVIDVENWFEFSFS